VTPAVLLLCTRAAMAPLQRLMPGGAAAHFEALVDFYPEPYPAFVLYAGFFGVWHGCCEGRAAAG